MSVNKVILVGNVGKEPEVRYLEGGTAVCSFPLATSETYRNRDGDRVTSTEWHNIVLWRGLAEIAERYVKKGSQLYIEGRIRTRSWDDRDGNKRYTTEIVGDNMQMLGRRSDSSQSQEERVPSAAGSSSNGEGASSGQDTSSGAAGSSAGDFQKPDRNMTRSRQENPSPKEDPGSQEDFDDIDSDAVSDDLPF